MLADFFNIPLCFLCLAILLFAVYFPKLQKVELTIGGLLVFTLIMEIIAFTYSTRLSKSNLWIYNIAMPIIQASSILIYANMVAGKQRKFFQGTSIIYLIAASCNFFGLQGANQLNTFTILPMGILLVLASYFLLRKDLLTTNIRTNPTIGFMAGNLIYYTLSITALAAIPLLIKLDMKQALNFKYINDASYSLWSICIATGIVWKKR